MSSIIDSEGLNLDWVNPVTQAPADQTLKETVKVTRSGTLIPAVSVTCVLDGSAVVFKNTRTNMWTGNTNVLGRLSLEIISLSGADTHFTINAQLTDNPSVQAPPLSVRFTSTVGSVSLKPQNTRSSTDKPAALTASVTDKNGEALPGMTVTFSASDGATVTPVSATTDINGQISVQVSSADAGIVPVLAVMRNSSVGAFASVGFYSPA